jgi:hypothetical protein
LVVFRFAVVVAWHPKIWSNTDTHVWMWY